MPVTLAQAQAQLAYWIAADAAVAKGQKFTWNGRSVDLPDANVIKERISYWERREVALSRGNNKTNAVASFL